MTQPRPESDAASLEIAILIVSYNSEAEIGACLEAAVATGSDVLVIDNASADGTVAVAEGYPVRVLANSQNLGFASAVNQGVTATKAPYLLLLNPDAVLLTDIAPLRDACREFPVAAAAGVLTGEDGAPQAGFALRRIPTVLALSFECLGLNRLLPRNPVNWRFRCFDVDLNGTYPVKVEQPAGALFLFRRDCWEALGGFDERFHPLWFEDVDFCARMKTSGKEIRLVPSVRAKHAGAHSILNMGLEIREIYWYGNLLRYAAKHFSASGRKLVCVSVFLGAVIRSIIRFAGRRRLTEPTSSKGVFQLAARCFSGRPGWDKRPRMGASAT